ncbi:MAG: dihydropteroate synthase [Rhodoferax sp.]|nr:dihydropteroate synthase [Rhodoferax sp.]
MNWQTSRFVIDLTVPRVMGIVNVTPDSFSDGGAFASHAAAMTHCEQLIKNGADILDIGGESTRPGARPLPMDEELARIVPVLRHALTLGVPVSVDTYKPEVMQIALGMGVDIVNDIWALRWSHRPGTALGLDVVAGHPTCGVCLMHMHREPQTMQAQPMQGDVVAQVLLFLQQRAQALGAKGVDAARICLDPGIGFGKTVEQNFALLARQRELLMPGYPLLAGWSRKSSLAAVTQRSLAAVATLDSVERMVPSVAAALIAVQQGASVVRVHDVKETVEVLRVFAAMQAQAAPAE